MKLIKLPIFLIMLIYSCHAFAQSNDNQQITFEGSLNDSSGNAINLANQTLNFYVYAQTSTGNCYLYGESSTIAGDSQGSILHRYGSGTPLSGNPNAFSAGIFSGSANGKDISLNSNCTVSAGDQRLIEVFYPGQNISASLKLGSVPYAHTAISATLLNGKAENYFLAADALTGGSDGQILSRNGSNGFSWIDLPKTPSSSATTFTGITNLNGASGAVQSFNLEASSGNSLVVNTIDNTHHFLIPMASISGTPAGLISNEQFNDFTVDLENRLIKANNLSDLTSSATARTNLGLGALATANSVDLSSAQVTGILNTARLPAFTGDITTTAGSNTATVSRLRGKNISTTAPTAGQVLKFDGTNWTPSSDTIGGGSVTSVSSANSDISVDSGTTTPLLSLNSGTGANQILKLNASAQIPGVNGSLVTNLNASNISAGTLQPARFPEFTGDITTTIGTTFATVTKIQGRSLASTPPASGQVLTYNGASWAPANQNPSKWTTNGTSISYNSGFVGIGTDSPVGGLHVKPMNNFDTALTIENPSLYSSTSVLLQQFRFGDGAKATVGFSDNKFEIKNSAGNDLVLSASGTGQITVQPNGVVRIGVSNTTNAKLDVNGSIQLRPPASLSVSCTLSEEGTQRYNPTHKTMEYCDGSYWQGVTGPTYCDSNFTLIGKPGTGSAFCISKNKELEDVYINAAKNCTNKSNFRGSKVTLCSETHYHLACRHHAVFFADLPSFMDTKYWLPQYYGVVDSVVNYTVLNFSSQAGSLCSIEQQNSGFFPVNDQSISYRCCYQ